MSSATLASGPLPEVKGAGKKASLLKNQLYAKPLPVGQHPTSRSTTQPRSWWDRLNEWSKRIYDNTYSAPMYNGWYDETTKSVWLYDNGDAQKLWTQGFFGKGNLSRSEPTWAERKQAERTAKERGEMTAEQMTQRRRDERKLLKIERARAAVKAGIQLPDGITALGGTLDEDGVRREASAGSGLWQGDEEIPSIEAGVARVKGLKYFSADVQSPSSAGSSPFPVLASDLAGSDLEGVEHFQLSMVEAFFLAGMLGCLQVHDAQDKLPLSLASCDSTAMARPDNPFLLSYIVYHHFRSLGWVVKSGTKFCVDYLLYKRGPVFSHAEFSILVVPEYVSKHDEDTSPFARHHNGGEKSWVWFSMMNRVNSQVQKCSGKDLRNPHHLVDLLHQGYFRVKEVGIRRWVPARMKP